MKKPVRYQAILSEPGKKLRRVGLADAPQPAETPLISCMMPTRGHAFPARFAIDCFQRQRYPNRELVVVCNVPGNEVERLVAEIGDPAIRYFDAQGAATVGDLRNRALEQCRGGYVAIWDDDDLYHPRRLALQMGALAWAGAQACFLSREIFWWPARRRLASSRLRPWENSMLARIGAFPPYPSLVQGEDTAVSEALVAQHKVVMIGGPPQYVRIYHGSNVCDAEHFELHFKVASRAVPAEDYGSVLAQLAKHFPVRDYAAALTQQAAA